MDLFSYATFPSFLLQHFRAILSFFLTRMRLQRKPGILEPGETDQSSSFSVCNKKICSEDIKMVMERLKIQYNREEGFCIEEMEKVLEEEITMEEAQEAFRVFDKNGDGYIDAMELRRVLGCLGFKKGEEECGRMIDAADENRDGRISFHEFLKLIDTPVQTYLQS